MHYDDNPGPGAQERTPELEYLTPMIEPCRFDPARYRQDLDGFDLTEDEAREVLAALWSIMASFVDIGFGVDSVQIVLDLAAQGGVDDEGVDDEEGALSEDRDRPEAFNRAASGPREDDQS